MIYLHNNIHGVLADYNVNANSYLKGKLFGDYRVVAVKRRLVKNVASSSAHYIAELHHVGYANPESKFYDKRIFVPYSRLLRDACSMQSIVRVKALFNEALATRSQHKTVIGYDNRDMPVKATPGEVFLARNSANFAGGAASEVAPSNVLTPIINEKNVFNFLLDVVKLARSNKEVASYLKKVAELV